nr:MAG TPA: hypothetical protein [Caudoviricetes sp.]
MPVILRISKNGKKNKGSSFRAVLFELFLNFVGFFLPVCKVSLLRCFSSGFSVIQFVKKTQMNLLSANTYISPVLAISKDRHTRNSSAIVSIDFPPKSGVFKSYVFLVYFSRQFSSGFKRQAISFFPLTAARKRLPL